MSKRMENWGVGDFPDEFRRRAEESEEEAFRAKLGALAEALEPMHREFVRETAGCGNHLGRFLEELSAIAARNRHCDRTRGFEETCGSPYGDVDGAIRKAGCGAGAEALRTCVVWGNGGRARLQGMST